MNEVPTSIPAPTARLARLPPEHIFGAYEFATANRARQDGKRASDGVSFFVLGIDHPYAVIGEETPSLLPEGAVAVRFHSIGGWAQSPPAKTSAPSSATSTICSTSATASKTTSQSQGSHPRLCQPQVRFRKKRRATSYFMVAAKDRIRVNCDLRHVTVVLCCDPKAFTTATARRHGRRRQPGVGVG